MSMRRWWVLRRSFALMVLLCSVCSSWAQSGPLNSIPTGHGYGAANAGRTGKLPPGPAVGQRGFRVTRGGKAGQGTIAGAGSAATGAEAGGSTGNVGTGGTEGAGTR